MKGKKNFPIDYIFIKSLTDFFVRMRSQTNLTVSKVLTASLHDLKATVVQRTFDMSVSASLQTLALRTFTGKAEVALLESEAPFIQARYTKVERKSPEFLTVYGGNDQTVDASFGLLAASVEPESVITLVNYLKVMGKHLADEVSGNQKEIALPPGNPASKPESPAPVVVPKAKHPAEPESIKVTAKFKGVSLRLLEGASHLVVAGLHTLAVEVNLIGPDVKVAGSLGTIDVAYKTPDNLPEPLLFTKLVEGSSGDLIDFQFATFDKEGRAYPGYDLSVGLQVRPLHITYIHQAILDLLVFGKRFTEVQEMIDSATVAASKQIEAAATAAAEASAAKKFKFDVHVKAPIVQVIRKQTSTEKIVLDLGELKASNQFSLAAEGVTEVDTISVLLSSVNIRMDYFRVKENQVAVQSTESLLTNLNLDVSIRRHIPPAGRPQQSAPAMEISGKMSTFEVIVSNAKLGFLLSIVKTLEFPASEGASPPKVAAAPPTSAPAPEPKALAAAASAKATPAQSSATVDLFFALAAIKLTVEREVVGKGVDESFGSIMLTGLEARTVVMQDSSMMVEVSVKSFSSQDSRPLTVENAFLGGIVTKSIALTFSNWPKERRMAVGLTLSDPTISLVFEYWLQLADIFMGPLLAFQRGPSPSSVSAPTPAQVNTLTSPSPSQFSETALSPSPAPSAALVAASTSSLAPSPIVSPVSEEKVEPPIRIEVVANITNAVVRLFGNPTDPHCDGLVIAIQQISFSMMGTEMEVKVQKFQIRSNAMGLADNPGLPFLLPFNLSTKLVINEETQDISVAFDPQGLDVSYRDLKVLLQISKHATRAVDDAEFLKPPQITEEKAEVDQFEVSSLVVDASLMSVAQESVPLLVHVPAKKAKKEKLSVTFSGLDLTVINNYRDLNVPFFSAKLSPATINLSSWSSTVRWPNLSPSRPCHFTLVLCFLFFYILFFSFLLSSQIKLETELGLEAKFFNGKASSWESLVEPFKIRASVNKDSAQGPMKVKVSTEKRMEVTVSHAFIQATLDTTQKWLSDISVSESSTVARDPYVPFEVRNDLGLPLKFWSTNTNTPKTHALAVGEKIKWTPEPKERTDHLQALSIMIEGGIFGTVTDIPVERVGSHVVTLRAAVDRDIYKLVCNVSWVDGAKVVSLRSAVTVVNRTSLPLELAAVPKAVSPSWPDSKGTSVRVAAGDTFSLPLPLCHTALLTARPADPVNSQTFSASSPPLFWKDLVATHTSMISCPQLPGGGVEVTGPFHLKVTATDRGKGLFTELVISAPLVVENLLPTSLVFNVESGGGKGAAAKEAEMRTVQSGERADFYLVSVGKDTSISLQIPELQYKTEHPAKLTDSTAQMVTPLTGFPLVLKLQTFTDSKTGTPRFLVYSPYLFLDQTGLGLVYRQHTRLPRNLTDDASSVDVVSASDVSLEKGSALKTESEEGASLTMFSYPHFTLKSRALIRTPTSNWCKPLSLESTGTAGEITMGTAATRMSFQVGVAIALGEGKFYRTKVAKMAPRYIVTNETDEPLVVHQASPDPAEEMKDGARFTLEPKDSGPLHFWQGPADQRALKVSIDGGENWTTPFKVNDVGEIDLRLVSRKHQRDIILRVHIILSAATLFVTVTHYLGPAPFRLENATLETISWQEVNSPASGVLTSAGKSVTPFVWRMPNTANKKVELTIGRHKKVVDLKKPGPAVSFEYKTEAGERRAVGIRVVVESATTVLRIQPRPPPKERVAQRLVSKILRTESHSEAASVSTVDSVVEDEFEDPEVERAETLMFELSFAGLGLSLVDERPQELAYLTVRWLNLAFSDSNIDQTVELTIDAIQLDDQSFSPDFPVVICQSPLAIKRDEKAAKDSAVEIRPRKNFSLSLVKLKNMPGAKGIEAFKGFSFLLQEMDVEVSEVYVAFFSSSNILPPSPLALLR